MPTDVRDAETACDPNTHTTDATDADTSTTAVKDTLYEDFANNREPYCAGCGKAKSFDPDKQKYFCLKCTPHKTDGIGRTFWDV